MKKIIVSLASVMGLCMAAGCIAPVDSQDDAETRVGEAEQALSANLPCTVSYVSFTPWVKITNNTNHYITAGYGYYTVTHSAPPTTWTQSISNVNLEPGQFIRYNAGADPDSLDANTCVSHLAYVNDP